MMQKNIRLIVFLIATVAVISGCSLSKDTSKTTDLTSKEKDQEAALQVVTTFYPMYDFARNVAQEQANVSMLIPAGTEPHDFEPSAKMIAQIEEADVFIYNSEEMETWVPSVLKAIDTDKVTVVNASEGIDLIQSEEDSAEIGHEAEVGHTHTVDPHVWLDPVLAQQETDNIEAGLSKADPAHAEDYQMNAQHYKEQLSQLDHKFQEAFAGADKRIFVTQHAAFAYLAKRYDLTQIAIAGLSPEIEPSPSILAELAGFVKENDIHYIYYEDSASSATSETLANETGLELETLSPIEGVSQVDQKAGVDYIKVMEQNLEALKKSIH